MRRDTQAILLLLVGLALLDISLSGTYVRYAPVGFRPVLVLSGVASFALAGVALWQEYRPYLTPRWVRDATASDPPGAALRVRRPRLAVRAAARSAGSAAAQSATHSTKSGAPAAQSGAPAAQSGAPAAETASGPGDPRVGAYRAHAAYALHEGHRSEEMEAVVLGVSDVPALTGATVALPVVQPRVATKGSPPAGGRKAGRAVPASRAARTAAARVTARRPSAQPASSRSGQPGPGPLRLAPAVPITDEDLDGASHPHHLSGAAAPSGGSREAGPVTSGPVTAEEAEHLAGRPGWLLLVPVLALLLAAPPALGAYHAARTGTAPAALGPDTGTGALPTTDPGDGPVLLTLREYAARAAIDGGASLSGRTVLLTGFVVTGPQGQAYLARIVLGCCAADARPIKVGLTGNVPGDLRDDAWIEVEGVHIEHTERDSTSQLPIPYLQVTTVRAIAAPEQPYE